MIFRHSILLALCLVLDVFYTSVLAEPSDGTTHLRRNSDHDESCECILQRKEWRALNDTEKKCYIDAVKCLQTLPAHNTSRPASWTRFDEFHITHIELALKVHYVAQFLPWHRLFVKSYENALRNECGYEGAQPYWNWTIDADPPNLISKSAVWDPVTGFGGDGVPGTYIIPPDPANTSKIVPEAYHGCIEDGPFAGYILKSGPGLLVTEHCITRGVNNTKSVFLNSTTIAYTLSFPTYKQFNVKLGGVLGSSTQLGPHGGGHGAVGGEMTNQFSSLGDPLFYLHHANIDRIWWQWQDACPAERLYQVDGRTSITPPYGHVTLDFPLEMKNIGTTLPIRDIMDIGKKPSCYTYV